jgi:hypothetical protein
MDSRLRGNDKDATPLSSSYNCAGMTAMIMTGARIKNGVAKKKFFLRASRLRAK